MLFRSFAGLAAQLRDAGFAVDAMLWLVADATYIADLNAYDTTWADRRCLDVEEAWCNRSPTGAGVHGTHADLAALVTGPRVVTAIGWTDFAKIAPLKPDAWLPQIYCTKTAAEKWHVDPRNSPQLAVVRYTAKLPAAPIECAHAAYDLAPGTIAAAVASAGRCAGLAGHWWWALGQASDATLREIGATA